jgi:aspartyl-tRNA(Asn)/glutamyl-tRNA(Gln) amidotransferase subunit B
VPVLALARQDRYRAEYGLSAYDAAQLTVDRGTSEWFDRAVAAAGTQHAKAIANFMQIEFARLMRAGAIESIEVVRVRPEQLAELVKLVDAKTINVNTARQVLEEMFASGADAAAIVQSRGLGQVNDQDALRAVVVQVLDANPKEVGQYLAGNEKVFGFFVGQAMKALKGKGNAPVLNELFRTELAQRK